MAAPVEVGFFGKLPSHGDFLRRRVGDVFVTVWDQWLQEGLSASRSVLADRWLDVYLTSPVWRFAAAANAIGPEPVLGLMVPSVDRVGRYFPLTVVATLPPHVSLTTAVTGAGDFLDRAEQLAVDTLAAERIDFQRFDDSVGELALSLASTIAPPPVRLDAAAALMLADGAAAHWCVALDGPPPMASLLDQMLALRMSALFDPLVIWWTTGSENVDPCSLVGRGLPAPDVFASLLDGTWGSTAWVSLDGRLRADVASEDIFDTAVTLDPTPPQFRSAGTTDQGCVRSVNQDAFLERPEIGLWVVADGLGGHSNGEVASRMVCDGLAELVPTASFEEMVEDASGRLHDVNRQLIREAERSQDGPCGSTAVALMVRGTRYAVVWAGDSRVYHHRPGGRLEQITTDHSAGDVDASGHVSTAITRAVGAEADLALDSIRGRVASGDRFLLCSDGLIRTMSDDQIEEWLQNPDLGACVGGLLKTARDAGAPDNVTIVVVEAYS